MNGQQYEVVTEGEHLWSQTYEMKAHGNATSYSSGARHTTPLLQGDVLTLECHKPSSPGSDVIDLPWFTRDSDGASGFISKNGPWGLINDDVLRKVT